MSALRRFRPPQPVSVQIVNNRPGTIGPPRALANGEQMARAVYGEVVWCAGPWRASGEWWNKEPWEREEWDVAIQSARWSVDGGQKLSTWAMAKSRTQETAADDRSPSPVHGPLLRLYRDLLAGTWFVEGEYD
jgi:protein ImuB